MGVVHKAIDTRLNRPVAIKAIPEGAGLDTAAVLRLRAEAQSAASLDHPYICKIYELLDTDAGTLIVMEFVEGETLASMLLREGRLPVADVVRYVAEIAEGLAAAHARGLVHRDVKPSNVMVTAHGHVKLLDFGIARNASGTGGTTTTQSLQTRPGAVAGSPFYMAPEQALGRTVDGRTDVFSLGVLFYECLSGELPFEGSTRDAYVVNMLTGRPRPMPALTPPLPKTVVQVIASCLERDPTLRPDAATLAAYLRAESPTGRSTDKFVLPQRRSWTRLVLTSLAFLALAVPAAWGVYRWMVPLQTGGLGVQEALVTGPAEDFDPRVSPDGRFVSFLSNRDGPTRLFVTSAERDESKPLTDPAYSPLSHAWSPDGSEIAVLVRAVDGTYLQVISAPVGGVVRRSVPLNEKPVVSAGVRLVRWVGSALYVKIPGTPPALWRIDPTSLQREELSSHWSLPVRPRNFDVSPDGLHVVVAGFAEKQEDLWVAGIDGTGARRVTHDTHNERQPVWTRGGEGIVFQSTRSGQWDLWELDLRTSQTRQLTSSPTEELFGEGTSTGSLQVFQFVTENSNLWMAPPGGPHIQLTFDALSDFAPHSSAGGVLAFQRSLPSLPLGNRLVDARVLVAHLKENRLVADPQHVDDGFAPQVSPDGVRVAYLTKPLAGDRKQGLLRVKDLRTGEVFNAQDPAALLSYSVAPLGWANQSVAWHPVTGDLYFVGMDAEGHSIRRIAHDAVPARSADGGKLPSVVLARSSAAEQVSDLYVSPDGRRLSYLRPDDWDADVKTRKVELREIDLATGADRIVRAEPWPHARTVFNKGWTKDGRSRVVVDVISRVPRVAHVTLVSDDGLVREVAAVQGAFPITARVDTPRDLLYVARDQGGTMNIVSVSLADGTERQVTSNDRQGVSFSSFDILPNGALVYAIDRRSSDIWVVR
jgi:serine/threonine protein kinase